ncbi:MAG: leucine-rich repeat domain-containing protein [Gammaproteobacteria bacterium]|nr:leucine-rich repeat domain-containing protein [Gammaproteobacteria bacterium]
MKIFSLLLVVHMLSGCFHTTAAPEDVPSPDSSPVDEQIKLQFVEIRFDVVLSDLPALAQDGTQFPPEIDRISIFLQTEEGEEIFSQSFAPGESGIPITISNVSTIIVKSILWAGAEKFYSTEQSVSIEGSVAPQVIQLEMKPLFNFDLKFSDEPTAPDKGKKIIAQLDGLINTKLKWYVNDIEGGDDAVGQIYLGDHYRVPRESDLDEVTIKVVPLAAPSFTKEIVYPLRLISTIAPLVADDSIRSCLTHIQQGHWHREVETLVSIDCSSGDILEGLEHLTALTEIRFKESKISDLSPIANMTKLKVLQLDDRVNSTQGEISDLSPLSNLTELTTLRLNRHRIKNISPLANLVKLVDLDLSSNEIEDLSPLENLTNLVKLDLLINNVVDIGPLAKLNKLEFLNISANKVSDIRPVSKIGSLKDLRINSNEVADLSAVEGLSALTSLRAYSNHISDLEPLRYLTRLTELDLTSNGSADLELISGLTNLTELYLGGNDISDIGPLAGLTSMTKLSLPINRISDLSPLTDMTRLTYLNLRGNSIRDIGPLSSLTAITNLTLYHNNISDVSPILNMTLLEDLTLYVHYSPWGNRNLTCESVESLDQQFDHSDGSEAGKIQWLTCVN